MKQWVGWIVGAALFLAAGIGAWRWAAAHKAPDTTYRTAPAERRTIAAKVTATGTLSARVTVQVGSQVSGRVSLLSADYNDPVKKGQVVAKIDPALFDAAVSQAQANVASAAANVVKAKAQAANDEKVFARATKLHDEQLASQADLDLAGTTYAQSKAAVLVAQASLQQQQAQLHQAEVNLSYTTIASPIDGTVISRSVDVGQTVAASLSAPTLFTIAEDLRKMQVNTNVAEGDVGRLAPQMEAFFSVDAFPGERFKGVISQIRNAASTVQSVVTYDAVIDVLNPDLKLRPGMTANTTILYAQKDGVLSVPNAALRYRPAAPTLAAAAPTGASRPSPADRSVYVLRAGAPALVKVRVGLSDGTQTEIVDGDLREGDPVVLEETSKGEPKPAGTAATPNPLGPSGSPGGRGGRI